VKQTYALGVGPTSLPRSALADTDYRIKELSYYMQRRLVPMGEHCVNPYPIFLSLSYRLKSALPNDC
jgi:hypothetical protein